MGLSGMIIPTGDRFPSRPMPSPHRAWTEWFARDDGWPTLNLVPAADLAEYEAAASEILEKVND